MHAGMVEDVEPRSSELGDPAVANVDQVMIVFSLVDPPWDGQMATRFLVCAERAQVPVCLVLNKADLAQPEQTAAIVKEVQVPSAAPPCAVRPPLPLLGSRQMFDRLPILAQHCSMQSMASPEGWPLSFEPA